MSEWRVIVGDCLAVLPTLEECSVDAVVTDPPYGLEFMGADWDSFGTSRSRAGMSKVGIPGHDLPMPSFYGGLNPKCLNCGRSKRGGSPCQCDAPEFAHEYGQRARALQEFCEQWAKETYRVLKPGGYLIAFGGTRTHHRIWCAIEDAGFVIKDTLAWMYGSGFPKSKNISLDLDRMAGFERETVAERVSAYGDPDESDTDDGRNVWGKPASETVALRSDEPVSEEGKRWKGFGTALKPSFEPLVLAQKPLSESSYARNVLKHGTGALNIGATRVETQENLQRRFGQPSNHVQQLANIPPGTMTGPEQGVGRWPPNLLLSHHSDCERVGVKRVRGSHPPGPKGKIGDFGKNAVYGTAKGRPDPDSMPTYHEADGRETVEDWRCVEGCPVKALGEQSGESQTRASGYNWTESNNNNPTHVIRNIKSGIHYEGQGTAARFFPTFQHEPDYSFPGIYCAKASRAEREAGLGELPKRIATVGNMEAAGRDPTNPGNYVGGEQKRVLEGRPPSEPRSNHHPTVKPLTLMRWLVRLITPPNGTVLDPFCGSGTTGAAATQLGFNFIGIDQSPEFCAIAEARIRYWRTQPIDAQPRVSRAEVPVGQMSMFDSVESAD